MFNKNVTNIARFDFINTMKSKGYIVLNIVLCLLVIAAINISSIIELFKSSGIIHSSDYILEVYDGTGSYYKNLEENIDKDIIKEVKKADNKLSYQYDTIDKNIVGVNIYPTDNFEISVEVITKDTISDDIYQNIVDVLSNTRNKLIEDKYNISEQDKAVYKKEVALQENILSNAKNQDGLTSIISTFIGYIIFMLVMTITTTVASSIANEKTSKSAEYILSTIPAKDYLNGKVLAANLKTILTLILIVFYVLMGIVINTAIMPQSQVNITGQLGEVTSGGVSFNLLGYIVIIVLMVFITNTLITYIQAALASKIKSISELDSAIMLPTVILVVAYFVSNMIPNTSNILTNILSCIPIFSMYILPTSYMLNKASTLLVIASFAVLLTTLVVVYKIVSSKFKNNLLDLGKKKDGADVDIALKLKEQEEQKLLRTKLSKYITCVSFVLILSMVIGNMIGVIPYFIKNENIRLIANTAAFVIYIGLPALVLSKLLNNRSKSVKEKEDKEPHIKTKVVLYLVGLVAVVIAQIINAAFVYVFDINQSSAMEQALTVPSTSIGILLFVIYLAVAPAIFEELLFRKVILNGAKRFGVPFAIIFTSIIFGLFHQNLQQILGTTLIGLVLAFVTVKTGGTKTAMCIHFTNNFFAVLAQILASSIEGNTINTLTLVACALILVIIILIIVGLVLLIKLLISNRDMLKIDGLKMKSKLSIAGIFTNYYAIILLVMIISTVVLNLKM